MFALVVFGGVVGWVLWRLLRSHSYFSKIPGPPAKSWLSGHLQDVSAPDATVFLRELEEAYGPVSKIKGPLGADWLYTYDPAAVYSILTKDQAAYEELEWFVEGNNYFLGPSLTGVTGDTHRKQRRMLHPVFSSRHIKDLTPTFYDVSNQLVAALSKHISSGPQDVDVLSWTGRTALELIGQAGIGYSFALLQDGPVDPFAAAVKEFIPLFFTPVSMLYHLAITYSRKFGVPSLARWLVDHSPHRDMQGLRTTAQRLYDRSAEIVERQKAALANGEASTGKDIMSVLLKANSSAATRDKLPDDQLIAQVSTLLVAATDTTSNTIARILYMLSENRDVQAKLREEILTARDGEDLSYETLNALPYLDAVCKETLRFHAPAPLGFRKAYRDCTLPFSKPVRGTDGSAIENVFVPNGSVVVISLAACNRNKALWGDDADEWKPERWLKPLPRAVEETPIAGVYANLMSFFGGGRSCIGFTFAILEMKVVLSLLIANFTFEQSADKPVFWNHSGVVYPSCKMGSSKPELWLKVGKFQRHHGDSV